MRRVARELAALSAVLNGAERVVGFGAGGGKKQLKLVMVAHTLSKRTLHYKAQSGWCALRRAGDMKQLQSVLVHSHA